jgi:predicted phage terminase large subunit-like protein
MPDTHDYKISGGYKLSSWDTASKITAANDYTAGSLWTVYRGKLYLEDYSHVKMTLPDLYSHILHKAEDWDTKFNIIEDGSSGIGLLQLYEANKKKHKRKFIAINADVKKKLSTVFPLLEDGSVILKRFPELMQELEEWPGGDNDDILASMVNAIYYWCVKIKNKNVDDNQSKNKFTSFSKRKKVLV